MSLKVFIPLIIGLIIAISPCHSQDTLITGEWKNIIYWKFKKDIEKQTGCRIWGIADNAFTVTLTVKDLPYKKVLDSVFNRYGYTWEKYENLIATKKQQFTVKGRIVNFKNEGLSAATVNIKGTLNTIECDTLGNFTINYNKRNFTIIVSMAGHYTQEREIRGESFVTVILEENGDMESVSVVRSKKPKRSWDTITRKLPDNKTGSQFKPDSALRNYTPARNIFGQLASLSGAILFTPSTNADWNQPSITIRNRGTIFGRTHPLIILNSFIFSGDINDISPLDILSLSILKDAVSTAQYGVQAGNGVILITTRTGEYKTPSKVSITTNITVGHKPDLFHLPSMSSYDHIDITTMLYQLGYYDDLFQNVPAALIPPAAQILRSRDRGIISTALAQKQLDALRNTDVRNEAMNYLYRQNVHQQFHASAEGGDSAYRYYFSMGYDMNNQPLIGNDERRITLNLDNTFKLSRKGPELFFNFYLSQNNYYNNGFDISRFLYPYEKLKDENGNPLPVTQTVGQAYKDSLATSRLLDWNLKPLDEINNANNKTTNWTFIVTTGLKHKVTKNLELNLSYRYEKVTRDQKNLYSISTYFTRNIINQFTRFDAAGNVVRPVPIGDILDEKSYDRFASNIIAQAKFDAYSKDSNSTFTFNAGTETRHINSRDQQLRRYDVIANGSSASINHKTEHPMFYEPAVLGTIPQVDDHSDTSEHFYSYFANGTYTYKNRVAASISIRKDESNYFGARTNQRGAPFISLGGSYEIARKDTLPRRILTQLRIRLSHGYCGNISRSFSAMTGVQVMGVNPWSMPYSTIVNPPNPKLSPETVGITNFGLDFILFKNKIWGSVEYFHKKATNLLGLAPIDPTAGVDVFRGNVAAMNGDGLELVLNASLTGKYFQWQSTLLGSYVKDKITNYSMGRPPIWTYGDSRFLNPVVGKPLLSIYSLDFRGLDPENGDPIGYLDSSTTKNYNAILQSQDFRNVVYHGPATPVFYGSLRNSFTWKRFELGFTLSWKVGHYFRRNSIKYVELFNGQSIGHSDISRRWKNPGDERITNIPSLSYPADDARDHFFIYSSALVEKADHIRLQDIRFQYNLSRNKFGVPFKRTMQAYIYLNNVALLYTANKLGIDPDFANGLPSPLNITIGAKFGL